MQKIYNVDLSERFKRNYRKLDKYTQKMIRAWINNNLVYCNDPRQKGKALTGNFKGKWRYRIGDYRLICEINDDKLIILALNIGHRKEIYNS